MRSISSTTRSTPFVYLQYRCLDPSAPAQDDVPLWRPKPARFGPGRSAPALVSQPPFLFVGPSVSSGSRMGLNDLRRLRGLPACLESCRTGLLEWPVVDALGHDGKAAGRVPLDAGACLSLRLRGELRCDDVSIARSLGQKRLTARPALQQAGPSSRPSTARPASGVLDQTPPAEL
jgi:hypothetical protein